MKKYVLVATANGQAPSIEQEGPFTTLADAGTALVKCVNAQIDLLRKNTEFNPKYATVHHIAAMDDRGKTRPLNIPETQSLGELNPAALRLHNDHGPLVEMQRRERSILAKSQKAGVAVLPKELASRT